MKRSQDLRETSNSTSKYSCSQQKEAVLHMGNSNRTEFLATNQIRFKLWAFVKRK